jgi:hypothetical protein
MSRAPDKFFPSGNRALIVEAGVERIMARRSRPSTAESLKELGIEPLPPDHPYYSSGPTITFTPGPATVAPNIQSDADLTKAPDAGADVEVSLAEHPDEFYLDSLPPEEQERRLEEYPDPVSKAYARSYLETRRWLLEELEKAQRRARRRKKSKRSARKSQLWTAADRKT